MNDISIKLGDAIHDLLFPLREGARMSPEKMKAFQTTLEGMKAEIVDKNGRVSIEVAAQLVEIYPLILGISPGHKDEGALEDWAVNIQDTILSLLTK